MSASKAKSIQQMMSRRDAGYCPICDKNMKTEQKFTDVLSRREFEISGLCQDCQDRTFDPKPYAKPEGEVSE